MKLIFNLAFRNLLRQKRRNLLLGIAIAFGMMILVTANSFSRGISDTLFNKIIIYMTGHINVQMIEKGKVRMPICRDKDRFLSIVKSNVTGIKRVEESVGFMGRLVGNGKSDNAVMVGIGQHPENENIADAQENFKIISGDWDDMYSDKYTNGLCLAENKAKFLNVKLHDTVRVRLQTVNGQQQSGILTVVGIIRSNNAFMDFATFLSLDNLKNLAGMKPWETGGINIILEDPKSAILKADKLHAILTPNMAYIPAEASYMRRKMDVTMVGFFRSPEAKNIITSNIELISVLDKNSISDESVIISRVTAVRMGLSVGGKFRATYKPKYGEGVVENNYIVTGIRKSNPDLLSDNVVLLADKLFYDTYNLALPDISGSEEIFKLLHFSDTLKPALSTEWVLLKRSSNSDEMAKKMKDFYVAKPAVSAVDVATMYETASSIVKMEKVLNLITLSAVLVLFFIILIGVVNTLRMTIKERTREIGTIRAIGMQRVDVRNLIVAETFLLALSACLVGIIVGFGVMWLTKFWYIDTDSMLSMLIVDKHLHFVPGVWSILGNMVLILFIAVATAWFPASRAAKMLPSEALRHHE